MAENQELDYKKEDLALKGADLHLKKWTLGVQVGAFIIALVMATIAYCSFTRQLQQENSKQQEVRTKEEEQRKKEKMSEDAQRKKDHDQQQKQVVDDMNLRKKEIEQREKEFKIRFYERQIDIYLELSDLCARLGWAEQYDDKFVKDFDRLHVVWLGKVQLLGDKRVSQEITNIPDDKNAKMPTVEFKLQMFRIVKACRESLREAFPNLEQLPDPKIKR